MTKQTSVDSAARKATRIWLGIATFIYGGATLFGIFMLWLIPVLNGHWHGEFLYIVLGIILFSIFVSSLLWLYRQGKHTAANLLTLAPALLLGLVMLVAWVVTRDARNLSPEEQFQRVEEHALGQVLGDLADNGAGLSLAAEYKNLGRYQDAAETYKRMISESMEENGSFLSCGSQDDLRSLVYLGELYDSGRLSRTYIENPDSHLMPEIKALGAQNFLGLPREQFLAGLAASVLGYEDMAATCWAELSESDSTISAELKELLEVQITKIRESSLTSGSGYFVIVEISVPDALARSSSEEIQIYVVDPDFPDVLKGQSSKQLSSDTATYTEDFVNADFPNWRATKARIIVVLSYGRSEWPIRLRRGEWYGLGEINLEETRHLTIVVDQQK